MAATTRKDWSGPQTKSMQRWLATVPDFRTFYLAHSRTCLEQLDPALRTEAWHRITSEIAGVAMTWFLQAMPRSKEFVFNDMLRTAAALVNWCDVVRPHVLAASEVLAAANPSTTESLAGEERRGSFFAEHDDQTN